MAKFEAYKGKLGQAQEGIKQAASKQALKQKMAASAREYMGSHAGKIQGPN